MLAQAVAELPNECCGLLGGIASDGTRPARVVRALPLVNALASPIEYESEPRSMFDTIRDLRRKGLEAVAVYHSHPNSPPIPSRTDLARNWSEQVVNLIISLQFAQPEVRGWWLTAEGYREASCEVVEEEDASA